MATGEVKLGIGQQVLTPATFNKLQAQAQTKGLLCEFGVPRFTDGFTMREKADRYRAVLDDRVCARITDMRIDEDGKVYGTVEAFGPHSKTVKQILERGQADRLAFAVRIVTTGSVAEAITYDLVKF